MLFRGFIAVELSQLNEIEAALEEIKGLKAPFKLVEPQNMHITLKFLGDIPVEKIPRIGDVMEQACKGLEAFEIGYKGLGAFPSQSKMNVVWVGLTGAKPMIEIAQRLNQGMETVGCKKEKRPFKPHLTLGRLKNYKKLDNRTFNAVQEMFTAYKDQEMGGCTINRIILKKSTLTPHGSVYDDIMEIKLGSEE